MVVSVNVYNVIIVPSESGQDSDDRLWYRWWTDKPRVEPKERPQWGHFPIFLSATSSPSEGPVFVTNQIHHSWLVRCRLSTAYNSTRNVTVIPDIVLPHKREIWNYKFRGWAVMGLFKSICLPVRLLNKNQCFLAYAADRWVDHSHCKRCITNQGGVKCPIDSKLH